MLYKIKKGNHYAQPMRLGIWFGAKEINRKVTFTDSCRYDLHSVDQGDTNKLFGAGKFWGVYRPAGVKWWHLWDYEHNNSARFGWRYDTATDKIELSAYCYVDKKRFIVPLGPVQIGAEYLLQIVLINNMQLFRVYDSTGRLMYKQVFSFPASGMMYLTGLYFGGNQRAPHDIYVSIKNP